MEIISLEKLKTKKNIFKLEFDNGESILLSADIIVKFGLNKGVEIADAVYKEVIKADKAFRVMFDALTLVGRRSYSAKSLQEKLLQKGYEPQNAKAAIERLKELEYINDEKYSKVYAKYLADRGKGEYAIRQELTEKGISKELIAAALSSLKQDSEPFEQIIKLIKQKFKYFDAKDKGEVRRIANFFLRRGFSAEDISKAFRNYKNINIE